MNILVIGSGGREHALAYAASQSKHCDQLYCAPGNGGMEEIAICLPLDASNHQAVLDFCADKDIGFVIIGPEAPLVEGLADTLRANNIKCFGPSAKAAQLEGSKGFTKDLCAKYDIPTAAYGRFTSADDAKAFIAEKGAPIVIKADGLAAGKGVIIAQTIDEANSAVDEMFDGLFGEAGAEVVVEEFLEGEEASFFALTDGTNIVPLISAQDHKRVGDNDTGPNTGGMGAYSPAPVMTDEMIQRTIKEILEPTVKGMAAEGTPYSGVLYAGLMITTKGPELIEYNARFGDPECQVLMMRLKSDLIDAMLAIENGTLADHTPEWHDNVVLTIVMASKGYPGSYSKNTAIHNIDAANAMDHVKVFHAGTKKDGDQILATGGRVLNVTASGSTVAEAQKRAYDAVHKISWDNGFYRTDIGWRAVEREKQ